MTAEAHPDPRVNLIRADHIVGRGTCSVIDECYDDKMLIVYMDRAKARSQRDALRWARRVHRRDLDRFNDIRGTAF